MATVGVIGLGAMGNPISRHLLSKNHQVTVYDVKEELARALESKGARVARDPAEVGEKSELNLVIVIDDAQVKEVCLGPKGIVEKAKEGAVIAIMSTVSPETCREVAAGARKRSIEVIDAPMVRGALAAEEGNLLLMVGGDSRVIERCRPILGAFATDVCRLGDVGAGQVGKMVNNLLLWACFMASYEGLSLGRSLGVDPNVLRQALMISSADNWALREWERNCKQVKWWHQKDLSGVLSVSEAAGVPVPLSALVKELIKPLGPREGKALFLEEGQPW
ncbi:MAG TPA: NAD(P)-dependent oxidoreductase [bacterium]|nr:NAD(P)-dependent oxidoreductase [bacterium]